MDNSQDSFIDYINYLKYKKINIKVYDFKPFLAEIVDIDKISKTVQITSYEEVFVDYSIKLKIYQNDFFYKEVFYMKFYDDKNHITSDFSYHVPTGVVTDYLNNIVYDVIYFFIYDQSNLRKYKIYKTLNNK